MSDEPVATPIIPPADDKPPKPLKLTGERSKAKVDEPQIGPKGPGTTGTASGKPGKLHRELAEFLAVPAIAFELKGDSFPAYVWTVRSQPFAYAVGDLAEKNPALKRWLVKTLEGGAYGQVVWTGVALLLPILAYYRIYPESMVNPFALNDAEMADYYAMMGGRQSSNGGEPFGDADSIPQPIYPQSVN
jgi:hypothetical protein